MGCRPVSMESRQFSQVSQGSCSQRSSSLHPSLSFGEPAKRLARPGFIFLIPFNIRLAQRHHQRACKTCIFFCLFLFFYPPVQHAPQKRCLPLAPPCPRKARREYELPSSRHLLNNSMIKWSRITLSRLTTAYFLITAIHCFIQIILQSHAFAINASAADNLSSLLVKANETQEVAGVAVLANDLRLCYTLPDQFIQTGCKLIWSGNSSAPALSYSIDAASVSTPSMDAASVSTPSPSATQAVTFIATSSIATSSPVITSAPVFTPASSIKTTTTTTVTVVAPTVPVNNGKNDNSGKDNQGGDDSFTDIVQVCIWSFFTCLYLCLPFIKKLQGVRNKREVQVLPDTDNFAVTGLPIDGQSGDTPVVLSQTCIQTLIWPVQT